MNIVYLANTRIPTEKAHGIEIMKLCEALAHHAKIRLIVPRRFNHIVGDPYQYHDVERGFSIVRLPVIDTVSLPLVGVLGFWFESITFAFSLFFFILFRTDKETVFLSHDNLPLFVATLIRARTYYDVHDFPVRGMFFYHLLFKRLAGVITTNTWKKDQLLRIFHMPEKKILVFPNGIDPALLDDTMTREEARSILVLPLQQKIIVYTGQLFSWKGVDTLCAAAQDIQGDVYIVGGLAHDVMQYKQKFFAPNLHFVGQRPHREMSLWQKAASVLVLPNTAKEKISKYYTSPMKLFEYMASGTPIVASDLPSIKYIAQDSIWYVMPDNAELLGSTIQRVETEDASSKGMIEKAKKIVRVFTWKNRAKQLIEFFVN